MLVDTVNAQPVEHIERSHPLGVTLSQIVIDRDHMDTITWKRIEEDWQGSDERLTFTCRHLGYLTLVQYDTTDELYFVVHHIPGDLVTSCYPVVVVDRLVAINLYEVVVYR